MTSDLYLKICLALVLCAAVSGESETPVLMKGGRHARCEEVYLEKVILQLEKDLIKAKEAIINHEENQVEINNYRIWFSKTDMNYAEAERYCRSLGARLAAKSIRDDETRKQIYAIAKKTNKSYWVGFDDRIKEGTYVWTDGAILSGSSDLFWPGEPNNIGNQDCGQILDEYNQLDDGTCSKIQRAICEDLG